MFGFENPFRKSGDKEKSKSSQPEIVKWENPNATPASAEKAPSATISSSAEEKYEDRYPESEALPMREGVHRQVHIREPYDAFMHLNEEENFHRTKNIQADKQAKKDFPESAAA